MDFKKKFCYPWNFKSVTLKYVAQEEADIWGKKNKKLCLGFIVNRCKSDSRILGLWVKCPLWRAFLKDSNQYFTRVSKKTTENSEWLDRQAQPGIEPGTSHLSLWAQNHSAIGEAWVSGFTDEKTGIRQLADVIFKNIYYICDNGQYQSVVTLKTHENFKWILSITDENLLPPPLFFSRMFILF